MFLKILVQPVVIQLGMISTVFSYRGCRGSSGGVIQLFLSWDGQTDRARVAGVDS